jgi:Rod binding domain-containing protein
MDGPRIGAIPAAGTERVDPRLAKLRWATREFEAVFLETLVREMNATTLASDTPVPLSGGDTYRALAEEALGRELAAARSVGIADLLFRQLSRVLTESQPEVPGAPASVPTQPTGGRPERAENESKRP